MGAAWDLKGCCDTQESLFLGLYAAYAIVTVLFYNLAIFKPMKLLSVFVHEMNHAM